MSEEGWDVRLCSIKHPFYCREEAEAERCRLAAHGTPVAIEVCGDWPCDGVELKSLPQHQRGFSDFELDGAVRLGLPVPTTVTTVEELARWWGSDVSVLSIGEEMQCHDGFESLRVDLVERRRVKKEAERVRGQDYKTKSWTYVSGGRCSPK